VGLVTAEGKTIEGAPVPPIKFSSNSLDLIRFFAALDVAIKHGMVHLEVGLAWERWFGLFPGVPIFFLISGFLIYRSYENSGSLRRFAENRFLRLYPGLWACFVVSLGLVFATGYLQWQVLGDPSFLTWAGAQLSFAQFYNWEGMRAFGSGVLNGSLWTISVELQFYALTPVAWLLLRGRPRAMLAAIAAFLIFNVVYLAFVDLSTTVGKLVMVTFVPWFYMFLLGAWVSTTPGVLDRLMAIKWRWLLLAYAVGMGVSVALGLPYLGNDVSPLVFLPLGALVLKAAFAWPHVADRLLRRNDISYGLYIYHMPVINVLMWFGLIGSTTWLVVGVVAAVVLAILSWLLVERPALKLKRRTIRTLAVAPSAGDAAGPVS
jgi:peptidoglycan/LPS O-acetylase OafA/YrhL